MSIFFIKFISLSEESPYQKFWRYFVPHNLANVIKLHLTWGLLKRKGKKIHTKS